LNDKFISRSSELHKNKYDYSKSVYTGITNKLVITCPTHGDFKQVAGQHLQGCGCSQCAADVLNYSSSYEKEICDLITQHRPDLKIERNIRLNRKELDIYLPDIQLAIEVNGDYWHSHLFKHNNYHKDKSDECEKQGIQLIHIWEHDWVGKKNIVVSMLLNKLNKSSDRIYARKCVVKSLSSKDYVEFLNNNHIQGHSPANTKLGLYYDNKLVSAMSFNTLRMVLGNKNR